MKHYAVCFVFLLSAFLLFLGVSAEEGTAVTLDTMVIHEDGKTITANISLTDYFAANHNKIYLFRVTADHNSDLSLLTPIAEQTLEGTKATITLPYDATDPSSALYGYILAQSDENGSYLPLSGVVYPSNFSDFAPHTTTYPTVFSKKGLQVQLTTDAQLLGVKHTIVNAFFNELITDSEEDAVAFVYGGTKYCLNSAALSALDYRIKSLTDAGIHIYLNYMLAFDTSAPSYLYYPHAEGNRTTMYAPNVSTYEGIKRYAAVMHFLAARYTEEDAPYGFCGSFILGYEVNQEGERHSSGLIHLHDFAAEYAVLLRTADTAIRSAYQNGRIFLSLSNRWDISSEETVPYLFGGKDLLDELAILCPDIPFGISINPYPSDLTMTDYWNDTKAIDDSETPYLTLKNISVLTEYLKSNSLLYQGQLRTVLIGEFGLSGKPEESEDLQAASYLYAYYTVCQNDGIEAFIWHRHVDHAGEKDLYYGLYASSDLLLEPTTAKRLHTIFRAVDTEGTANRNQIEKLLPLLPNIDKTTLFGGDNPPVNRTVYEIAPSAENRLTSSQKSEILFDFSQSLYGFYPTDNAAYLEQCEELHEIYMRIGLLHLSPKEYMGVSTSLSDLNRLNTADYLTIRFRITATNENADIRLLLTGNSGEREIILDGNASVSCNEWVTLSFPLSSFTKEELASCTLKFWTRMDSGANEELLLDIAAMTLHSDKKSGWLHTIFLILIFFALTITVLFLLFLIISRRKKRKIA